MRDGEAAGPSGDPPVVDLVAGDGVLDPLPGLTLVFGAALSGRSMLLTYLARVHRNVQAWIPEAVFDPQWPQMPGVANRWRGWNDSHPLDDRLLPLALLCHREPATLLVDSYGRGGPRTGVALAEWKRLVEDTGHRIVLVMDIDAAITRWLSPASLPAFAHQVVVLRSRVSPRLVPERFQPLLARPDRRRCGEAIIYSTDRPHDAGVYRVPDLVAGEGLPV